MAVGHSARMVCALARGIMARWVAKTCAWQLSQDFVRERKDKLAAIADKSHQANKGAAEGEQMRRIRSHESIASMSEQAGLASGARHPSDLATSGGRRGSTGSGGSGAATRTSIQRRRVSLASPVVPTPAAPTLRRNTSLDSIQGWASTVIHRH